MTTDLSQPQIMAAIVGGGVAAVVSLIVAALNQLSLRSVHRQRLNFDHKQADRRARAEIALAEKKLALDRALVGWKRRVELAEQALTGMYEVRDVFSWVRARVVFLGEGETREPDHEESAKVKARRDRYCIPIERLQRDKELFARLHSQRYAFAAYFGPEAVQPFIAISEVHQGIMGAASVLIQMAHHEDVSGSAYNDDGLAELKDTIGWGVATRPDDIDKKIEAAIKAIETICSSILTELPPRIETQSAENARMHADWSRRP
jgi:hypothetical protein